MELNMYECINCGMLPFACMCIPWCYKHDVERPCDACEAAQLEQRAVKAARTDRRFAAFHAVLKWLGRGG